ncbi:hypothetical protein EGW08_013884 [Elysia chlorotica]|uniref:Centromere protein O n=1 Tax=Elysia chlorotica TaxID=188477 RepID=A0A3S1BYP5_ELYCH|nr:hypothetical protein EGW08_013884 [Elysia chlorotica]
MNAYTALQELRQTRNTRFHHAALCDTVREQLDEIVALQKQKAGLEQRLGTLTSGQTVDELNCWDDPDLSEQSKILRDLREKLAAYRLIGPCGLTVSNVESSSLVVTFTPMWLSLSEVFYISLKAKDDGIQVSATNMPYFFNVSSLVDDMKTDVASVMDSISVKLAAYVQRKAEFQLTLKTHADVISFSSCNEPVTSLDLEMQSLDASTEIMKRIDIYVTYSTVESLQPARVQLSKENISISEEIEEELRHSILTSPFSTAVNKVVEFLISTEALVEPQSSEAGEFVDN